jgi:hypothetical protein
MAGQEIEETAGIFNHSGIIHLKSRGEREGTGGSIFIHIIGIIETIDPVDACCLVMEPVVFQFIGNI